MTPDQHGEKALKANRTPVFTAVSSFVVVLILLCSGSASNAQESLSSLKDETFRMAMNRPVDSPYYIWTNRVYSEIFSRLDIEFELLSFPFRRASAMVEEGFMDGEAGRIFDYKRSHPNLFRVGEPTFLLTLGAYAKYQSITLDNWDALERSSYKIGYPMGVKICENNLIPLIPQGRLTSVKNAKIGLKMLQDGRVDVYVDDINAVEPMLRTAETDYGKGIYFAGIMTQEPLYLYVSEKHRALIPKLNKAIKAVKDEGLVVKYYYEAFGRPHPE